MSFFPLLTLLLAGPVPEFFSASISLTFLPPTTAPFPAPQSQWGTIAVPTPASGSTSPPLPQFQPPSRWRPESMRASSADSAPPSPSNKHPELRTPSIDRRQCKQTVTHRLSRRRKDPRLLHHLIRANDNTMLTAAPTITARMLFQMFLFMASPRSPPTGRSPSPLPVPSATATQCPSLLVTHTSHSASALSCRSLRLENS